MKRKTGRAKKLKTRVGDGVRGRGKQKTKKQKV